jgi:hypothetical protein
VVLLAFAIAIGTLLSVAAVSLGVYCLSATLLLRVALRRADSLAGADLPLLPFGDEQYLPGEETGPPA